MATGEAHAQGRSVRRHPRLPLVPQCDLRPGVAASRLGCSAGRVDRHGSDRRRATVAHRQPTAPGSTVDRSRRPRRVLGGRRRHRRVQRADVGLPQTQPRLPRSHHPELAGFLPRTVRRRPDPVLLPRVLPSDGGARQAPRDSLGRAGIVRMGPWRHPPRVRMGGAPRPPARRLGPRAVHSRRRVQLDARVVLVGPEDRPPGRYSRPGVVVHKTTSRSTSSPSPGPRPG